jgi:hypothetical protein
MMSSEVVKRRRRRPSQDILFSLSSVVDLLSSDRRQWRLSFLDVARETLNKNRFDVETSDMTTTTINIQRQRHPRHVEIVIPVRESDRIRFKVFSHGQLYFFPVLDYAWDAMMRHPTKDRMAAFLNLVQSVLF